MLAPNIDQTLLANEIGATPWTARASLGLKSLKERGPTITWWSTECEPPHNATVRLLTAEGEQLRGWATRRFLAGALTFWTRTELGEVRNVDVVGWAAD